ncbi:MAG TPA: glycosyltransferase family 2 protein [Thermoplasmata archaeon]|nr:glycosyltransferase family 2 protein [Thermoplasmata archaeon]
MTSRVPEVPTRPPDSASEMTPFISVVVTAHGRRQFLREAVGSVLAQTLPRSEFEVCVVKDFADLPIDTFLEGNSVGHVETDEVPLGAKLAIGTRAARGEVLTFLEDDDAYAPERLRAVADRFRASPELGYFRNGQHLIGENGADLPESAYGQAHRNLVRIGVVDAPRHALGRRLGDLARVDPDFNLSSIAVRRSVLLPHLEELRGQRAAVDSFVFYAALSAGLGARIDPTALTRYRVHGSNVSLWGGDAEHAAGQRAAYQRTFLDSFRPIYERTVRAGPPAAAALAGSAYFGTRVLYDVLTGDGGGRTLRSDLRRFVRVSPWSVLLYRRDISAWGTAAALAPRRARSAFLRRRVEESRRARG